MDHDQAWDIADALSVRGISAAATGSWLAAQFAVRVTLPDGRDALWDTEGGAGGLEAQILRDGVMVGLVPVLERSETYTLDQLVDAIENADYYWADPAPHRTAEADGGTLAAGTLRRFIETFRE